MTAVEPAGEGHWKVTGDLTLHSPTYPKKLDTQSRNGHYQGAAQLKQMDFGIEPVSIRWWDGEGGK